MIRKLLLNLALAVGLIFVAQADKAQAASLSPSIAAPATAQAGLVEQVRWRCGPAACWWTPGYVGVVPDYAMGWGPPLYSHCYWRINRRGVWKYRC